tara:strand:+ start:1928 stop:2134 length:207 start_codon:yes stop_codon:yes gene_type:complete
MNWKEVLVEQGFKWDDDQELHIKHGGFGRKATVWMFMKGLFIITENNKVTFDGYIKDKEEFIKKIKTL